MTSKPIVLAVVSDVHAGSTVAVCPDEGVRLDDGGRYTPSKAQLWLWQCWNDYWRAVAQTVKREKAELYVVYNGDATEGDHHGSGQIISKNPEAQLYVTQRVFGLPKALGPVRQFMVRGTEAHVGPSGASEEALGRWLGAERDPETKTWSWWRLRLVLHRSLVDCLHHGRAGQRPWTEQNIVALLANQIFLEHARRGERAPDLAIRSHMHKHADSYHACPTRVVQTASFQLKTAYVHKVAPESLADVGGIIVRFYPDRPFQVDNILFRPELPAPWTA